MKSVTTTLKRRSIIKLIKLNKTLDLCDAWRIRDPKKLKYTFRKKHLSRIIQRRLYYIFISQNVHKNVEKPGVLNALSTDHHQFFAGYQEEMNSTRQRQRLVEV